MKKYQISLEDMNTHFFHFTEEKNLSSICKEGIIPNVGAHAKYIEKSEKVFFIEGLDNLLILLDCWTNVFYYKPVIPFIYTLGAYFLRQKWFPMVIADSYFGVLKKSKIHQKRAFRVLDKVLDNSILLKIDLEENVDFKYDDKDEIKQWGYKKRHLELMGYSKEYSTLEKDVMDRWNMHTLTGHGVSPKKISVCVLKSGKYKLRDIFNYCLENTSLDIETICPVLFAYLKSRKLI